MAIYRCEECGSLKDDDCFPCVEHPKDSCLLCCEDCVEEVEAEIEMDKEYARMKKEYEREIISDLKRKIR